MKKITILLIVLAAIGAAYYLISPLFITIQAPADMFTAQEQDQIATIISEPERTNLRDDTIAVVAKGTFQPGEHAVAGLAAVIERDGERILRFQDFDTVNGPNLHIWLATNTSGEQYIDLGPIRATTGNVNYEIPDTVDLDTYNHVLVWCVPFRVLFSYAQLQ